MRNFFLLLGAVLFVFSPLAAQAALQVFPTRLFLSPQKRVAQLTLRHNDDKPETYRITAIFYRMTADGKMEKVDAPGAEERPLLKYVRFSPREVKLSPHLEQTVKVMALPNEAMQDGEYRAHILFEPVGEEEEAAPKDGGKQMQMKISARVAVAIPVFYRQGNPELHATADQLKLEALPENKFGFQTRIQASGKKFLYGDLKVWFTPSGGKPVQVGTVLGVSSYVPSRMVRYPLTVPKDLSLKNGVLKLELSQTPEEGGTLLSSTETKID